MGLLKDPEFSRGWPVLGAAFLGMMFGLATVHANTLGVLTPELSAAFGWSRSEIQASFAVLTLTFMASAPVAGTLVNRFGARPILLVSIPLLSLTFMAFALVNGSLSQFYLTAFLNALVGAGTLPMAYARVVTGWFPRRTGLALALAMLGPGVLAVISVPVVMWISGTYGWRAVYLTVGVMPLVIYPIIWIFLKPPPDADAQASLAAVGGGGASLFEALREWRLWVMGVAFLLASASIGGCLTNLPTLLSEAGLTRAEVMMVAPALGASAILGRVAGGGMLDRWWAPGVGLVFMLLLACGLALLGQGSLTPLVAAGALMLIGFSNGVEHDLLPYMVSRYFGMRAYASVYGVLFMFAGFGGGMAPIFFNLAYDLTGSFSVVLIGACALIVLAGFALLSLGRYKHFAGEWQPSPVTVVEERAVVAPP